MQFAPCVTGKCFFEIGFDCFYGFAPAEFPSAGKTKDVGIDGEGRVTEGLIHNDAGGFMADARKGFQFFEGAGYLPAMSLYQQTGGFYETLGFGLGQAAGGDVLAHLLPAHGCHCFSRGSCRKECRGDLVDPGIGALGGEHDGHQEGKSISVMQGYFGLGKGFFHFFEHDGGTLGSCHTGSLRLMMCRWGHQRRGVASGPSTASPSCRVVVFHDFSAFSGVGSTTVRVLGGTSGTGRWQETAAAAVVRQHTIMTVLFMVVSLFGVRWSVLGRDATDVFPVELDRWSET